VSALGRKNSREDGDDPKNKASFGKFFWSSSDGVDVHLCDLSGGIGRVFAISMRGYGQNL
jgi:hypothetical protein